MNTNRYKELEGNDPDEKELTKRVEYLQNLLIGKTEHCVEYEVLIQEKDKLLM